jgi:hypothetical protein
MEPELSRHTGSSVAHPSPSSLTSAQGGRRHIPPLSSGTSFSLELGRHTGRPGPAPAWADLAVTGSTSADPAQVLANLALAQANLAAAGSTMVNLAPARVDLALVWADPAPADLAPAR